MICRYNANIETETRKVEPRSLPLDDSIKLPLEIGPLAGEGLVLRIDLGCQVR